MSETINHDGQRSWGWLRYVGWGGAAALVLLPLVAMRWAPDAGVNWTPGDFVFAIVVIGGVGLAFELALRMSADHYYRAGAGLGLLTAFLLVWSNAAVGYIGDDNSYNILFFGIVVFAFLGAIVSAFRPRGMALTMLAAGLAHAVAGGIGYPQDPVTGPITIVFTGMWLTSAFLFHKAAPDGARA